MLPTYPRVSIKKPKKKRWTDICINVKVSKLLFFKAFVFKLCNLNMKKHILSRNRFVLGPQIVVMLNICCLSSFLIIYLEVVFES